MTANNGRHRKEFGIANTNYIHTAYVIMIGQQLLGVVGFMNCFVEKVCGATR